MTIVRVGRFVEQYFGKKCDIEPRFNFYPNEPTSIFSDTPLNVKQFLAKKWIFLYVNI
jgi:hypothetical protein